MQTIMKFRHTVTGESCELVKDGGHWFEDRDGHEQEWIGDNASALARRGMMIHRLGWEEVSA